VSALTVNLSQSTWNTIVALRTQNGASSLSDNVNLFFTAGHTFSTTHPFYSQANLIGSTGRLDFSDGGYELYSGVVDLTPESNNGQATATAIEEYSPNGFRLSFGRKLNFDYTVSNNGTSISGSGGTITAANLQTLLPTYSPSYNSQIGNVSVGLHGTLTADAAGGFHGTVTSLDQHSQNFVNSGTISGNFSVSGNGTNIGMGLSSTALSGTMTSFLSNYLDGSQISLTGASIAVTGATVVNERIFADAANFAGDDAISITLPSTVATPWTVASGSGNDTISIRGGAAALSVDAGTGNDTITLLDGGHKVDGGEGVDTVNLTGARKSFNITKNGDAFVLTASGQSSNVLQHVETIKFDDTTLSVKYNDVVQALYVGYFGRAADLGGPGNFQQQLINLNAPESFSAVSAAYDTNAGIRELIDSFSRSDESKALYSGDTTTFVNSIYKNVFNRAADTEGLKYWVDAIDHLGLTKANASLSIMSAALLNTSVQGKLDAALVNNRTAVASDFSFAIDTSTEMQAYSGNAAAAAVRNMLAKVDATTDLVAFQATVQSTLSTLERDAGLVGIAHHDNISFF
jgi:hypothetical protein